nr:MAG: hypothetical protein [Bacteriophage sp.]
MSDIRMAKMKKAENIKVGDKLVKFVNGKMKHAEVTSIEPVIGKKGGDRIRINYGGFAIVRPDTEMEVA